MVSLEGLIIAIIVIPLLYSIVNQIMTFLGVPSVDYSSYMNWFMALIIFFVLLPKHSSTIFG